MMAVKKFLVEFLLDDKTFKIERSNSRVVVVELIDKFVYVHVRLTFSKGMKENDLRETKHL